MSVVQHSGINRNIDNEVNIELFKRRIEEKRQELLPIVAFYQTLRDGWIKRGHIAEVALENIQGLSKQDRDKLNELIDIAVIEIERIDDTFRETSQIFGSLRGKIQDLDMLALRQSSAVPNINATFDIESINRIFHQADALIELRQEKFKELTQ